MYKTCKTFFPSYILRCKKDTLFKLVIQNFFKKDHSIHLHFSLVILIHTRLSIIYMQKMSLSERLPFILIQFRSHSRTLSDLNDYELRKMKIKVHFNEIE